MSSGVFYFCILEVDLSFKRCLFIFLYVFTEIPILNASSVQPNQVLQTDQGPHYLPLSLLWSATKTLMELYVNTTKENNFRPQNIVPFLILQ